MGGGEGFERAQEHIKETAQPSSSATKMHAKETAVERTPRSLDPWKHRAQHMRCKTCMFFVPKETQAGLGTLGRCRRHAPTMGGYPAVFVEDWCGDHKIDEGKI